ncbi:MAG: chemotaxis response regulator protein-glutamate methylesterase [Candidatus Hydrothermales bacterium]
MSSDKIKVLIVDDSYLMRVLLSDLLSNFRDIEVVGTAKDGEEALRLIKKLKPDVVTLDYEMPGLTGLEVLEQIMSDNPIPCIMLSAYTTEGAEITLKALSKGAFDFVAKPSGSISVDIEKIKNELYEKIKLAKEINPEILRYKYKRIEPKKKIYERKILAIGIVSSTGGPPVIEFILKNIPNLDIPIFIVQHMPKSFISLFVDRLKKLTGKNVVEAKDEETVKNGYIYIAPGGIHMTLKKLKDKVVIDLIDDEPKWGVKPSGDYILSSIAEIYGEKSLAIILTGMGKDGSEGARKIKNKGGIVISQNKETSVIYGMPAAVKSISDFILSPEEIAEKIQELI